MNNISGFVKRSGKGSYLTLVAFLLLFPSVVAGSEPQKIVKTVEQLSFNVDRL